ncbi:hypothetical protein Pla110_46680 [Polystyrenella longa]|uniref:Uncharacterized protein n=1 Tax=Polystyrenella longa TaxID=2528007 RepID=A0A518CUK7_9PLAN|nr:hypothetical protein [Polystyrenella longa]QDU82905.1 hypothetical protein Pla110_46680 [Polystyrenella longa]
MRTGRTPISSSDKCSAHLGLSLISYGLLIVAVATSVLIGHIELCLAYLLLSYAVQGLALNKE